MDRTIIVPYRAEEKELSNILYNAIKGLMLLHPPTEDLRKCLSDEMFIKPNQQAFFHVMHYLFRIFDPQEFKKRFFWPITDKRSESNFRTSTVEYLKHINEKYHLNWTNIKSYLVVMPGGMKFISFLLDFVNFIVHELVKQKEKQLNLDGNNYRSQVCESNLHKMCAKNEFFKGMASEFIYAVENLNTKYDAQSRKLMQHLEALSQECGLPLDLLMDEKFVQTFEEYNHQLFESNFNGRSKKILEMDNLICALKEATETFYSKETTYKYDKQRICQQLTQIRHHFSIEDPIKGTDEDGVNIDTLISIFNVINETMQNELKIFNKKPCAGEFVHSRLLSLKTELEEIETQITNFKKILNENMKKCNVEFCQTPIRADINGSRKRDVANTLLMKLVSTPPIKFEVPEGGGKSRLALVDSKSGSTNEANFNNFLAPPRAIAVRQLNHSNSLLEQTISDLNNTISRSKIIDPIQLLRSTSKKESHKYKAQIPLKNISNMGSKWNQRQSILNDNDELIVDDSTEIAKQKTQFNPLEISKISPQSFTKTGSTTILQQSSYTPFNSNDRTRIVKPQYQIDSTIIDGDNSTSLNYVKKLSAVTKVKDASLNFTNLSTSPSGRLEPLVKPEDFDVPKLKVNDVSVMEYNVSSSNSIFCEIPKLLLSSPIDNITIKNDNNNKSDKTDNQNESFSSNYPEEDALFNISDSVLKDITL